MHLSFENITAVLLAARHWLRLFRKRGARFKRFRVQTAAMSRQPKNRENAETDRCSSGLTCQCADWFAEAFSLPMTVAIYSKTEVGSVPPVTRLQARRWQALKYPGSLCVGWIRIKLKVVSCTSRNAGN